MLKGNLAGGIYRRYLKAYFTLLSAPFKIPTDNSSLFWSFFLQTIRIITHQILQWRIEFWHFFSCKGELCVCYKNNTKCRIPSYTG